MGGAEANANLGAAGDTLGGSPGTHSVKIRLSKMLGTTAPMAAAPTALVEVAQPVVGGALKRTSGGALKRTSGGALKGGLAL